MTLPASNPDSGGAHEAVAADYLIASIRCDIAGLEQLLHTGRLVAAVSNLVHALQRERGTAHLYLAAAGRRAPDAVDASAAESRVMEAQFRTLLGELKTDAAGSAAASRLYSRLAAALHRLAGLNALRAAVRSLGTTPETVMLDYSGLIQSLMAVVFEAADSAADPDVSRMLVAMFHLMQGKEFAGQERAVGAAGYARGGFTVDLAERMRHLIDGQERCFRTFAHFADQESLVLWRELRCEHGPAELERMRRIALTSASGARTDTDFSDAWFDAATQRIDGLKRVEDRVEAALEALCQRKLAAAREDLKSHRDRLATLETGTPQRGSLAVFINQDAGDPSVAGDDGLRTGVAGAELGRSLVELVQSQSDRLQTMAEELAEARAALTERKTIDRAKGLLMQHRGLSEEEAYRFLRRIAMAQSRKLAEVARDTIAMAEVLKPHDSKAGGGRR